MKTDCLLDFSAIRIGYVPFSPTLQAPGDRRRFVYYAQQNDIAFEIARPEKNYDIILLTQRADLSVWSKYPRGKTKIVYDLVDSYLSIPKSNLKSVFRGTAKYLFRENKFLRFNYWNAIRDMCLRADAVVCSTLEQKDEISKYSENVNIILDYFTDDIRCIKHDYRHGCPINIVWEGLPENVEAISQIKNVLRDLSKQHAIKLHIISDIEYWKYLNKVGKRYTLNTARKIYNNVSVHNWNEDTFSKIATGCDIAIIPLDLNNPLMRGKPENKLVLFWKMGIPTIVTGTPAYVRAMKNCGLDTWCNGYDEWYKKLDRYIKNVDKRRQEGIKVRQFAEKNYSDNRYHNQWEQVLKSIL